MLRSDPWVDKRSPRRSQVLRGVPAGQGSEMWCGWVLNWVGSSGRSGRRNPPGSVVSGEAEVEQPAKVEGGGAGVQPGVVLNGSAVADLPVPARGRARRWTVRPSAGTAGSRPARPGLSPVGGAPAAAGHARCRFRIRPLARVVHRSRNGQPRQPAPNVTCAGRGDRTGQTVRAGHRARLLVDGEVVDGEPARDGRLATVRA